MFLDKIFRRRMTSEKMIDMLAEVNLEGAGNVPFDRGRAVETMRGLRATLSRLYGVENTAMNQVMAAGAAVHMETIRATAQADYSSQKTAWGRAVDPTILAAMRLAEDTLQLEGDVFAAVVSPIELGMDSRVWVSGDDKALVEDFNDRLNAWDAVSIINYAWQDMETYSAFYIQHRWEAGVPKTVHLSPKYIHVGPDRGYGPLYFEFLGPRPGDEPQTEIEFAKSPSGGTWNEWAGDMMGKPLPKDQLTWHHFMKPPHKMYPYPWVAKGATPVYTRQIIEEMRLGLVQGLINQLWVMTIEDPQPKEITKLRSVIAANRAERIGFLLWRAGLKVDIYSPESVEQLLLPEAWWSATLDIFRRIGRTVRIVSGESSTKGGQGSVDAEIDVRIAQNKAMAHRNVVARKVVMGLAREWPEGGTVFKKAITDGKLRIHMTPIQLFLGEELEKIWSPMWNYGMASVHTIHAASGLDTEYEAEMLKTEKEAGFEDVFTARQQFAQRTVTPGGEVTKSPEPGRPTKAMEAQAASSQELEDDLLEQYDGLESGDGVKAFMILFYALIRAHMREAYVAGYNAVHGNEIPSEKGIRTAVEWERQYIDNYQNDLLNALSVGRPLSALRYRVGQHVQSSFRRAYMDGVFQAKAEDGWMYWQRVLRPWLSKTGPCEICREDSTRWHPITEPFWDHPYGVCSAQLVRFMRSSTDGWDAFDRQQVEVPVWEFE